MGAGAVRPDAVPCPDCGQPIPVPPGLPAGARFECPACAGTWVRLVATAAGWRVERVVVVSCPAGDSEVELPADVRPGDVVVCGGHRFVVTYEYGAYALAPAPPGV